MGKLRAAWNWLFHPPKPPDLTPRPVSNEGMEWVYPNLARIGVTPHTDIWAALELLAAEMERHG